MKNYFYFHRHFIPLFLLSIVLLITLVTPQQTMAQQVPAAATNALVPTTAPQTVTAPALAPSPAAASQNFAPITPSSQQLAPINSVDSALQPTQNTPPIPSLQQPPASLATPDSPDDDPAVIQAARDQAFSKLTLNALPMTSEQIQKLRNLFADSQRAATAAPGGVPPKAVASTQLVSLEPGSTPPLIRLSQGYVTSIVFLDSTSAPWPIQSYDLGNPSAFNVQWEHSSNILMIQSSAMYTTANLVVQLKGLNTPISISLIPGQPIVDYRVDLRVQGMGPNAKPGSMNTLPDAASNELIQVLDGVPPGKAKVLKIPDSEAQAWMVNENKMYLRTRLTLLSPAWIASMSSADGMNAYEIPKTPSILVSNNDGKIFNLRVEGY